MGSQEHTPFSPHYLSLAQVRQMYQRKEQPLNEATISTILKPLAGTSFLQHATELLAQAPPGKPMHLFDFFMLFDGYYDETHFLVDCPDPMKVPVATALYLLSGSRVPLDSIYIVNWMEPDELLFQERRNDRLWHDQEKTQVAGEHTLFQYRLFKAGQERKTLSLSQFAYQYERDRFHIFTHLLEDQGSLPHRFFSDWRDWERPALPFLEPQHQGFRYMASHVCISPQFSFGAATTKQQG